MRPTAAASPLSLRPSRAARTAAGGLAAVLAAAGLAACSPQRPDPRPAAEAFAAGLQAGDLSAAPMAGDASAAEEQLNAAVAGLGDAARTVVVEDVAADAGSADPATATARLSTTWDLDGKPEATDGDWTYQTTATLEYDAGASAWRVRYSPAAAVAGLQAGEGLRLETVAGARGDILGAGGTELVTERPVVRVGLDKARVQAADAADSARELAKLLDIDADAYAAKVDAAGAKAFVEAIVLRDDSSRTVTNRQIEAITGGRAIGTTLPLAPTRTFARPVLGTVGEATAEIVEKSGGAVKAGERVGLSGLQATYQERLAGTPGMRVWTVPAPAGETGGDTGKDGAGQDGTGQSGGTVAEGSTTAEPRLLFERAAVDGLAVTTTLEQDLQEVAEKVVSDADSPSAVVAVRPSDGAVLAAANGPASNAYNTAMVARYAPGSTFKVVSALAMLRSGYTPSSRVECPQTTVLDGRTFKNFTGYPADSLGTITLSEAIAQSCNTVFINASRKVEMSAVADAAASLGLAAEPATGSAAFLGSVPSDSTGTEHAANMIGQGVVEASPLGMATVAASVAKGSTVSPRLVADPAPEAAPAPQVPLTAEEAAQLKQLMSGTVDHGTVTDLQDVPGPAVQAKTGTAEYGDGSEELRHTWVIAIQGDLAVAVFVETGFSGAETGGPLMKEFLTKAQAVGTGG
ncbi:cell division protein FtsI [Zafaria cholistanensis]|uniref:Beta-lactamase n=1 Tax=Zafaria cholistanensis TaxID=1682741 RepID=A0A5A7NN56_9MICC|nr:penicillin-binding transpeptidase domain-containing protein [Zafaria cholistanensis]GER22393.1 cell division protein FtsI [Zafaria cholistanensis]